MTGRVKICLNNFNKIFSDTFISELSVAELEDYVEKRKDDGLKNSSISLELSIVKQMVKKAFYSDKISG